MVSMCRWAATLTSSLLMISVAHASRASDHGTTRGDLARRAPDARRDRGAEGAESRAARRADLLKDDLQQTDQRVDKIAPITGKVTGYMDFGFFVVDGTGAGIQSDTGHYYYPEEYEGIVPDSWTFMGDPLSTAINARGEPATTGESRAITFDSIKSKGPRS